jgi:hypothetical protein
MWDEKNHASRGSGREESVMRRTSIIGFMIAMAVIMAFSIANGAPWKGWHGSGGWGMGSPYQRMYDPAAVGTVSGTVESVDKVMPMKGMQAGIHLTVRTETETVDVHLGPEWYIERLDTRIEKGDRIEVKGSRVVVAGKHVLIAAEVKKGETVLVLRDKNGVPVWAGWRR